MEPTADLYDRHGEDLRSCATQFRSYGGRREFHGTISTIKVFEDNTLVKEALTEDGTGRVLVVDGAASLRAALLGDLMAARAAENSWEGIVVNGAVRDVVALGGIDVGVKALGSNPRKSSKTGAGLRDVPVSFGGVTFAPGDHLYSDADGILVADA
jgi:regulator of ribonuclease activity A